MEDNGKNGGVYEITLAKFPVDPVMNNLFAHRGDPMAKDFTCDTTRLRTRSPVTCKMSDVNLNNIQGKTSNSFCITLAKNGYRVCSMFQSRSL